MSRIGSTAKWFIVAAVAIAIAVGIYAWIGQEKSAPTGVHGSMTAAEKAYESEIEVRGAQMSAASNFLGSTLYYLNAQLTNHGNKTVRQLELNLAFMDPFGDVVYRQTEQPVTSTTPPLKPGATEPLHLTFEHLPTEWNQGPPNIVVSYVGF